LVSFLKGLWLLIKYLPALYEIAKTIEANAEETYLNYQIKKDREKIESIFMTKGKYAERARELNDIFRS
jgi:ABC-type enterochelin transport system substrate-binding protein